MTHWVSSAYKKVCLKYSALRRYFEKTGALMTTNGAGDGLICPVKLPDGVEKYTFEDAVKDAEERAEGVALTAARLQGAEAKEEEVEQKQDNALEENEDEEEVVSQFELSDEEGLAAGDVGGGADGAGDAYFLSWGDGVWC
jgi:hypothetical protein